jgi:hypothetical protein
LAVWVVSASTLSLENPSINSIPSVASVPDYEKLESG